MEFFNPDEIQWIKGKEEEEEAFKRLMFYQYKYERGWIYPRDAEFDQFKRDSEPPSPQDYQDPKVDMNRVKQRLENLILLCYEPSLEELWFEEEFIQNKEDPKKRKAEKEFEDNSNLKKNKN